MTIRYKVGRANFGGQERAFPRLVPGEAVTGEQFQEKLARRAARGMADVVAILTAQREVLLEELLDEQSVHIPGIGFFTFSLKGELDEGERLVTESARLKINCRAETDLTKDVNKDLSFEYVGD